MPKKSFSDQYWLIEDLELSTSITADGFFVEWYFCGFQLGNAAFNSLQPLKGWVCLHWLNRYSTSMFQTRSSYRLWREKSLPSDLSWQLCLYKSPKNLSQLLLFQSNCHNTAWSWHIIRILTQQSKMSHYWDHKHILNVTAMFQMNGHAVCYFGVKINVPFSGKHEATTWKQSNKIS